MKTELLIILACVPLYVVNAFCDKFISAKNKNKNNYVYNSIKFLICCLCLVPALCLDDLPKFQLGCLLCGIACGIMYAISKTIIMKGYEKTSVAFMTFCHSAGMIVPCLIGHFFWSETLSAVAIIGIALAIASIVLLTEGKKEKKDFDPSGIIFGVIIFLTSGGVMIAQKLMGLYFVGQSVIAYNFYSFVVAFLILCLFARPERTLIKEEMKFVSFYAFGSAVSLSVISLVMTNLAGSVPSIILFPLFNGLGIIFVCVGSIGVFHEKMTVKKFIGLAIGILGLCLVNF